MGAQWRSSDARGARLLSRNRLAISLLRRAVDVFSSWATYYPARSSFVEVWQWASSVRLSEVFLRRRRESCCVREDGVSALASTSSTGVACCGLFDELVATADWNALGWEKIDDDTSNGSRPYLVQPVAWNVPFFAPGLTVSLTLVCAQQRTCHVKSLCLVAAIPTGTSSRRAHSRRWNQSFGRPSSFSSVVV